MTYKKLGVVGATGRLGTEVTRALVEEGFEVVPFSRKDTTVAGIPTQRITPETSFVGFDVIISVVGPEGWPDQIPLIARAKADGVKRFVPSEFGMDHRGEHVEYLAPKENALKAAQEAGFADGWTAFINGFFETVIPSLVQWDLANETIRIVGKGTTAYPFIFRHDIGRAIAQTLKAPAATYKDTWVLIASGWASGNEIAQWVEEAAGKKLSVEHVEPNPKKTPIVSLLETSGRNVFDRSLATEGLGVQWADLKGYVTGLVRGT
ncbi:hypothetical protein VTN77DRAFT_9732 [Rasamsonia byssochlamydoides]|uniref:uncharacterized protein n=1 Tax=Rasamsonia byssochlamydoides TaxID=89139 RepID=UPI0037429981